MKMRSRRRPKRLVQNRLSSNSKHRYLDNREELEIYAKKGKRKTAKESAANTADVIAKRSIEKTVNLLAYVELPFLYCAYK